MLQSMGSQRVGHNLLTELNNQSSDRTEEEKNLRGS